MKTTREFQIAGESGTFRIAHHSADWRQDVGTGSAIIEVQKRNGTWLDFMVIRSEDEIARIEKALRSTPITTVTPVDAEIGKILAKYFPSVETFEARNMDSLDWHEVFVADLKHAVAEAFAAGRDFETRKIAKKAAKKEVA